MDEFITYEEMREALLALMEARKVSTQEMSKVSHTFLVQHVFDKLEIEES
jgi:hypothetical protein